MLICFCAATALAQDVDKDPVAVVEVGAAPGRSLSGDGWSIGPTVAVEVTPNRFGCIQDSRAFCQTFFPWYNDEHRHSGIGMMSPAMVHYGLAAAARENRQATLDVAYAAHPERFVRRRPAPPPLPKEVWISKPLNSDNDTH